MDNIHQNWIEYLKACGQSIVDNAESIVGSEPYLSDVTVSIYLRPGEAPYINVDRTFYPEEARNLHSTL